MCTRKWGKNEAELTVFSHYNVPKVNNGKNAFQVVICKTLALHVINCVRINNLISQCANRHVRPTVMQKQQSSQTIIAAKEKWQTTCK